MSDHYFQSHMERLQTAASQNFSLTAIPEWIEKNTWLGGEPFSFVGHEYQLEILRDQSREIVVRKCAQIGLTELSVRYALALSRIIDDFTVIYTLPTAGFAANFTRTRVDPIIASSEDLRHAINSELDNSEIKQLGSSFLYFKGTIGTSAAISVPAHALIHDETDHSNQEVLSNYESRLAHSPYKIRRELSTPTVDKFGISASFNNSRRHWNLCKCSHCSEWFLPDYFKHVKIPGYDADLRHITKENLHGIRWKEARLVCPACGKEPDLRPAYRSWVLENKDESHEASGYQIQPFDAPAIITPSYLVERSTKYKKYGDFINFNLGLPHEDNENTLTQDELKRCHITGELPTFTTHVIGADMGLVCHVCVGAMDNSGNLIVVHRERVPIALFRRRFAELCGQYRATLQVIDSQPYFETLLTLQQTQSNLFGAVYTNSKKLETYSLKNIDADIETGQAAVRQVLVNRNKAFDSLMDFIRVGKLLVKDSAETDAFIKHCIDMKRIQKFTAEQEMQYVWVKSPSGDDHYHHALLYLFVAAQLQGMGVTNTIIPMGSMIGSFRMRG